MPYMDLSCYLLVMIHFDPDKALCLIQLTCRKFHGIDMTLSLYALLETYSINFGYVEMLQGSFCSAATNPKWPAFREICIKPTEKRLS